MAIAIRPRNFMARSPWISLLLASWQMSRLVCEYKIANDCHTVLVISGKRVSGLGSRRGSGTLGQNVAALIRTPSHAHAKPRAAKPRRLTSGSTVAKVE